MTIRVKFFAIIREKAGRSEVTIEPAEPCSIEQAIKALSKTFTAIAPYLDRCAFAVNREYVPVTTVLHDNDELAVIPPVSGG